jgi:uncharacterized protein YmfQ (DUF2313 family)
MATDHADLLKLLLPAVAYDKTGIALAAEIQAGGAQLDAFAAVVEALMDEIDPRTTTDLLAAWERVYGLPDACGGADVSAPIEQRRAALAGKVAAIGGLSKAYFLDLAGKLGYTDTAISRYPLVTCESSCESPVRDDPRWRFAWQVNLPHESDNYSVFRADSGCTTAVDSYLTGLLECVFLRLKPAHTFVLFTYEEGVS